MHLAAEARRGTHAILATRVLSLAATAVSITLLSRLIAPAAFGVWAVAVLALALATIVREMGLVSAIVQAPNVSAEQRQAYFWTSVAVSLASALLLALAAPVLARLYAAPLLAPVIWLGCISLALAGFGLVPAALLRRDLRYGKVAIIEGGGMLCSLAVSLAAAYAWRNVWALVAGHIASALWMSASALALYGWRPRAPRRGAASLDLSFSLQMMSYNLLTYAGNNVGVAAGYRLAAADLGFFNRAQQLYNLAHFALLTPVTEVGVSQLSRLKAVAYRDAYIAVARRVWVVFLPYAAVLPLVSGDLVLALLGTSWQSASPILAWFAPAVLGQAFAALFAQLMASQGRGRELRRWAAVDLLVRGAGAASGSAFGIVGVAAGFSLATLLVAVPMMAWLSGRAGPVRLREQWAALWPGLLIAAAATGGAVAALPLAQHWQLASGWTRLLVVGGGAALAWAALCLTLRPARDALLGRALAPAQHA